jgi:hypothetical protein
MRAREPMLRQLLKENERLTLYRLGNEMNDYWEKVCPGDHAYLSQHSKRGQSTDPHAPEPDHIYSLIGAGVDSMAAGKGQDNAITQKPLDSAPENRATGGGGWAKPGLRQTVRENPIDPVQVHRRTDAGLGRAP